TDFSGPSGKAIKSLKIVDWPKGTLTLLNNLTVNDFWMDSGTIAKDQDKARFVRLRINPSSLTSSWTGGTIDTGVDILKSQLAIKGNVTLGGPDIFSDFVVKPRAVVGWLSGNITTQRSVE